MNYGPMNPLTDFIEQQGFAMLDGGLATELESRGADLDHELWSARMLSEAPDMIRATHIDFLKAGADIIATASYQASIAGFRNSGFSHAQSEDLLRLSVELGLQARDSFWSASEHHRDRQKPLVAISIGPYGATLHDGSEYHGNYALSRQALQEFHHSRMEILAACGADLFAFETIPSLLEAEVLLDVLQRFPGWQAWLSFSCRNGKTVSHGEPFAQCAALAEPSEQIIAVGANCTAPRHITRLLESTASVDTPRVVYPNSGEEWQTKGNRWSGQRCELMEVEKWHDLGARLIGGCCRTSLHDVSQMRSRLAEHVKGHGNTARTIVE